MKTGKYYNRVQVYLPDQLAILFSDYCTKHELSSSAGAKEIINGYLNQYKEAESPDFASNLALIDRIKNLETKISQLSGIILDNQENICVLRNRQGAITLDLEAYKKLIPTESLNELITELKKQRLQESSYELIKDSEGDLANEKLRETYPNVFSESVTDSVNELFNDLDTNSSNELSTELITGLLNESVSESDIELLNKPFNEPVTDSVNESVSEPVTESSSEPVNESVSELVIDSVNETSNNNQETEEVNFRYILKGKFYQQCKKEKFQEYYVIATTRTEDNVPLYIGGKAKTILTKKPLHCKLYKGRTRATKSKERFSKKFNIDLTIYDGADILDIFKPDERLAMLKYWGKEDLFKKFF